MRVAVAICFDLFSLEIEPRELRYIEQKNAIRLIISDWLACHWLVAVYLRYLGALCLSCRRVPMFGSVLNFGQLIVRAIKSIHK